MRPRIQDPALNTAECVIEGHKTGISAIPAEHRAYIRTMLWCSFAFTITFALFHTENDKAKNEKRGDLTEAKREENKKKKQKLAKAIKAVSCVLSIGKSILLFTTTGFSVQCGNTVWDLYVILPLIFVEGLVLAPVSFWVREKYEYEFFPENTLSIESVPTFGIFLCANLTMYYFCWLVIGIMINPLWGITVLLVFSVVIAVTVFLVFIVLHSDFDPMVIVLCLFGWFSKLLLVTLVIFAGQSFFIRETANEVVKATLLYLTTALMAWIISKVMGEKSDKSERSEKSEKSKKTNREEEADISLADENAQESGECILPLVERNS